MWSSLSELSALLQVGSGGNPLQSPSPETPRGSSRLLISHTRSHLLRESRNRLAGQISLELKELVARYLTAGISNLGDA
jgi:hypothetical protein